MLSPSNWHMKGLFVAMILLLSVSCFAMDAEDAPEAVTIDSLAKFYEPVEFDHAMHVDIADCSTCHHHTTGTGPANDYCARCHANSGEMDTVACQDCHSADPFSAESIHRQGQQDLFHTDKIGLKGAYHQNCLGCHQKMDGPVGCEDCHAKSDAGEQLFHSGKYAPAPNEHGGSHH